MLSVNVFTLALAAFGLSTSTASPIEPRACKTYEIVTVKSTQTFVQRPFDFGYGTMVNRTLSSVNGGSRYDVPYPASVFFDSSIAQGEQLLYSHLKDGIAACPQIKYAIVGYSQGAEVTSRVLINVSSSKNATIFKAIKAVVVVGNTSHQPKSAVNLDENGAKGTDPYVGSGILKDPTPKLASFISSQKLRDICYNYDNLCAKNQTRPSDVKDQDYHSMYDGNTVLQKLGSDFLIGKLTA